MNDYTWVPIVNNKNAVCAYQECYMLHNIRLREAGKLIKEDSIVVVV